eukprot:Platyproteum_vivax@DN274_c0_g1_i1.p2
MQDPNRAEVVKQRMANRFEVDHRAALFSSRGPNTGGSGKTAVSHTVLEEQNEQYINDLEGKVSSLKNIALGISKEAKESNSLLDSMSGQFDNVKTSLGNTMKQLGNLMQRNGGLHMWAMAGFVVFVFLVMYFVLRRK